MRSELRLRSDEGFEEEGQIPPLDQGKEKKITEDREHVIKRERERVGVVEKQQPT